MEAELVAEMKAQVIQMNALTARINIMEAAEAENRRLDQAEAENRRLDQDAFERWMFQLSLDHLPKYNGESGSTFRDHVQAFMDWVNVEELSEPTRLKMALIFSLQGTPRNRVRHAGVGTNIFNQAATLKDYIKILYKIFYPEFLAFKFF